MEKFKDIQDTIKKKDSVTKAGFLVFAILIPIWIISSKENIILFHFFIECFIVLICASITIIIVNTKEISDNDWFKVLGLIFVIISIFEFLHTTLYKGMTIMPMNALNQSIQFGLCENYIESLSMLIFLSGFHKRHKIQYVFYGYTIVSMVMLLGIFAQGILPVCYIEEGGFTAFKLINEYIILIIYVLNIIIFKFKRSSIKKDNALYIGMSILFALISHIFFAFNSDLYNITNIFAHIFKLLSLYLIYRIVVKGTLNVPLHILNMKLLSGYKALVSINERLKNQNAELEVAKKELTKSKENLRRVIDNLPIAIILRKEETIVFANSKAVSFFSAKNEDDIVGKNVLEMVHPEYRSLVKKEIENSKQGMVLIDSEEKVIDLYGNSIDVEVSALPIIEDNQNLVMIMFRDVTERKRSELMEKKLNKAKEDEKLHAEFFANLSHEFRTPVNLIYSSCQLLDVYIKQNSVKDTEKYNDIIKQNCYRILRLINNLIDTTKLEEGYYKGNFQIYNIISVIEEIVLSVSSYIENRGIELIFDTETEEKYMLCDADMMERIILNLISNAIKYVDKPGGKIEVNIYDFETYVTVSIKDNGKGIPKEKQERIFERFVRVDNSLNRDQEGSGIGLYIVKSLVNMHHGTIELKSEEKIGTEFIINLPVDCLGNEAFEESCLTQSIDSSSLVEKIKIEFSDIYMN